MISSAQRLQTFAARPRARNEPAINIEVVARHPPGAKPLFKSFAAFPSAECRNPSHGRRGFVDVAHNITGLPAFYYFGDRTVLEGDTRRAARQCFNHDESEGLRPVDWEQQRGSVTEELALVLLSNLSDT